MTTVSSIDNRVSQGELTADGYLYLKTGGAMKGTSFNTIFAKGSFGSGTLTIEISPNGEDWFLVPDSELTAEGFFNFQARFYALRVELDGSTDPELEVWSL
jgi:hypothetical protein